MSNTRFAIFAALFALATCAFHAQKPWVGLDLRTLSLVAALVVLLRPSSVALFIVFIVLQTAAVYRAMPWVNTNRTLHFLVGITVLASLPALAIRKHPHGFRGQDLLAAVEPALRLELLIVYVFSFWHKLNTDFIDASTSCAVALYGAFVQNLAYLPLPPAQAAAPGVIFGTLLIEAALPLLLVIRRTRTTAVLVGAGFHFFLGIAWFYSFSATMVALLFLFSPLDLPKRAAQWWQGHRWIVWYGRLLIGAVLLMVLMGVALSALREYVPAKLTDAAQFWATIRGRVFLNIWFQYAIAIVVLVLIITRSTGPPMGARRLLFGGHPALLFFPLCAVLNGLCPYLGLKTETSFAMYSNLRTEAGQSNHLIVRKPLSLADYQTNLVRIVDSSDEVLAKAAAQGLPIPLIEVRKRIWYMAAEGKSDIAAATGPRH